MFRFYKITTFADGSQWIDVGGQEDLAFVNHELAAAPLAVGLVRTPWYGRGPQTTTEFLVYEG